MSKRKVLFLCTHNSARSHMAEGLMRALRGDEFEAFSAGLEPTHVDPDAIRAMAEMGIDISRQSSKGLDGVSGQIFDIVVTVCDSAKESCPYFPRALEQIHKSFEDPAVYQGDARMAAFRRIRDEIAEWIRENF
ncbi:MAG: arsenate reductase ArsC [Methanotrichaceae archaeon]|nr:arsenate reductase ArsC [Methanotrichaceae archaeon]